MTSNCTFNISYLHVPLLRYTNACADIITLKTFKPWPRVDPVSELCIAYVSKLSLCLTIASIYSSVFIAVVVPHILSSLYVSHKTVWVYYVMYVHVDMYIIICIYTRHGITKSDSVLFFSIFLPFLCESDDVFNVELFFFSCSFIHKWYLFWLMMLSNIRHLASIIGPCVERLEFESP